MCVLFGCYAPEIRSAFVSRSKKITVNTHFDSVTVMDGLLLSTAAQYKNLHGLMHLGTPEPLLYPNPVKKAPFCQLPQYNKYFVFVGNYKPVGKAPSKQ